jgi:hypothetical protein
MAIVERSSIVQKQEPRHTAGPKLESVGGPPEDGGFGDFMRESSTPTRREDRQSPYW